MSNKLMATLWLFWGISNFLIFAYDIQNDRDYWTWIWLLTSQVSFLGSLRYWIKHDRE
jgi:hypothetical protein